MKGGDEVLTEEVTFEMAFKTVEVWEIGNVLFFSVVFLFSVSNIFLFAAICLLVNNHPLHALLGFCFVLFIIATVGCDTKAALNYLRSLFHVEVFDNCLPPIILHHQLYSIVHSRTVVDKQLVSIDNELILCM